MSDKISIHCRAKINLWLKVIDRRPDGYHDIDTLFQTIDLGDRLELEPLAAGGKLLELVTDQKSLPTDGRNLVIQAANCLIQRYPERASPVSLRLFKRIPLQGGLGGGSSNAAATLRLLVRAWDLPVDEAELHEIACRLGADVPFFLLGGTARGRGRGDRLEAIRGLEEISLVLGLPPFGISTEEVFGALSGVLTLPRIDDSFPDLRGGKWPILKDLAALVNDLEQVVFHRWPVLGEFCDELRKQGALHAMLSGSGSTVFGLFSDELAARQAADNLRAGIDSAGRFGSWTILQTTTSGQGLTFESEGQF